MSTPGTVYLREADVLEVRHLQAGHGQALGEQLDRDVDIDIVSQP